MKKSNRISPPGKRRDLPIYLVEFDETTNPGKVVDDITGPETEHRLGL